MLISKTAMLMLSVEILGVIISVVMPSFVMLSATMPNIVILCHFAQHSKDADYRYVDHLYHYRCSVIVSKCPVS